MRQNEEFIRPEAVSDSGINSMKQQEIDQKLLLGLSRSVFFGNMTPDRIRELLLDPRVSRVRFDKDDVMEEKLGGRPALAYILEGSAVVLTRERAAANTPKESRLTMRELSGGRFYGPAVLFSETAEPVSEIRAKRGCEVVFFEESLIEACIRSDPDFAMTYIRFQAGRIRFLNRRIALLTRCEAKDALLGYLMNEADRRGETFRLSVPLSELAAMLDMSRSSLYRSLDSLEEDGFIRRRGRQITLHSFLYRE